MHPVVLFIYDLTCVDSGSPVHAIIVRRAHMFVEAVDPSLWGTFVEIIFNFLAS